MVIAGRYKGQKVVAIGPHPTRLSDETLVVRPGTDGALAMAMGHVLLKEFFLDRAAFAGHAMERTDLPFLVRLREHGDAFVAGGLTGRPAEGLSVYGGDSVEVLLPRFDDGPGCCGAGCRWSATATSWRRPCSTCCWRCTGWPATGCPGTGPRAMTIAASRTRLPGRRRTRGWPPRAR